MLKIEEINSKEEFKSLGTVWNKILSNSKQDKIFLSWEWLYTWWETYSDKKILKLLLFKDNDGNIQGFAPFYIGYEKTFGITFRVLRMIGSEEVCSEYLDVIAPKEKENEITDAIVEYFKEMHLNMDIIFFNDILETSIIYKILKKIKKNKKNIYLEEKRTTNPFILLPEKEELFTASLSSNKRGAIKRKEKKLKKDHGFYFKTVNGIQDIDSSFDEFVDLHQKLWQSRGLPGMFKRKNYLEFHKTVARRFAEKECLNLTFLLTNGKAIASLYGFQNGGKYYYYQSGFDPDWKIYGVGQILLKHSILEAIRNNLSEYDFLRGETSYKYDFTSNVRHTKEIIVASPSYKANIYLFERRIKRQAIDTLKHFIPSALFEKAKKIRDRIALR